MVSNEPSSIATVARIANRDILLSRGISEQALHRGTGARGLRAILEEVLLNTMYEIPGRTDVARVVFDEKSITTKSSPELVMRNARVTRQRRAAS